MPIVMNQPESPRVTGNPRNAMVSETPYLQNEFCDPRFAYVFNLILSYFSAAVKVLKKSVRGNFWAQTSSNCNLVGLNSEALKWEWVDRSCGHARCYLELAVQRAARYKTIYHLLMRMAQLNFVSIITIRRSTV